MLQEEEFKHILREEAAGGTKQMPEEEAEEEESKMKHLRRDAIYMAKAPQMLCD